MARWARIGVSEDKHPSGETLERLLRIKADAKLLDDPEFLRAVLLDFIADFANWDNSTDSDYLATSRALVQAAHEALGGEAGTRPMVIDPFAGGGSIPLEALRVGADAFASDLNPIPVLLNKVMLEYVPKYGQRLADEVRKWGHWVKQQAERELAECYPKDADGSTPIAYLWARTVRCEGPACGVELPLLRAPNFSRKRNGWHFEIIEADDGLRVAVREGMTGRHPTVANGKAICPRRHCGYATPAKNVREQLAARHGGARDARLLAVCVDNRASRRFRNVMTHDTDGVRRAQLLAKGVQLPRDEINPVRPYANTRGLSAVTRIGMRRFGDLYTDRQAVAITVFQRLVESAVPEASDPEFRKAVTTVLSCACSRLIFQNCCLSRWHANRDTLEGAFSKQALQNTWDFAESNPISDGPASWSGAVEWVANVIEANCCLAGLGSASQAPAQAQMLPDDSVEALITDPPYFAAIPYGDLSDVFFVWEREFFQRWHSDLYCDGLVKKLDELIVTNATKGRDGHVKGAQFFQQEMTQALSGQRVIVRPSGIGVIVFADSKTESWEAMLGAVLGAGWTIAGSWPLDTELQNRTQAAASASLQSSVHLVCRPRERHDGRLDTESVGEWREVLAELPERLASWMPRLAAEGVVGADAIFACLGPALEIFSRYSRVEKASGEKVELRDYLEHVWAAVSNEALSMIFKDADAAGLEPDARLTAMWLWTLGAGAGVKAASTKGAAAAVEEGEAEADEADEGTVGGKKAKVSGFVLEFDAARKIAQGLGIHLEKSASVVEVKGDKARLLPVAERVRHLFGKEATEEAGGRGRRKKKQVQRDLFEELEAIEGEAETGGNGRFGGLESAKPGSTVLDKVHQSMVLFASGRGEALRRFLVDDGVGKDGRFWKLAQALSALYPAGTDEKRWVDGVLARKKGLRL